MEEKKDENKMMGEKSCEHCCECCGMHHKGKNWGGGGSSSNAVYGLGFLGALIYFISTASNVGVGLLGILKAIIWPVYFVYYMFEYLGL